MLNNGVRESPAELGNCYPTVSSNFHIGRLLARRWVKSWLHCQPQETAASTAGIEQAFVKVEVQQLQSVFSLAVAG